MLSYDHDRQKALYKDWLGNLPRWQSLVLFMGILALPVMLLALWLYWRGRPIALDPADRLWRKLSQHFTRAHLG
ncbi:hypothetical protein C2W62_29325 [Candidatus Entotheonella serta]|nr:hypothetical protein C2W62_29325 [Candidatus Entotheonella serta]